jgi:tetratricopeptide (TPR) repeat protein
VFWAGRIALRTVLAETITLKSGKKIEGKILEKTDWFVKIEVEGTHLYYELKYIENIEDELSSSEAKQYFERGLKYGSQARFLDAQQEFKKGLEKDSSDNNLQEALAIIDDLNKGKTSQDYTVSLFKGTDYLINAEYEKAIEEFKNALSIKTEDSNLSYYLGICNYQLEKYEEAINYFQKSLETISDDEVYYYAGSCYYYLDQYPQAIDFLSKAVEINPNNADAYCVIGTSNYLSGDVQKAKENLNKAKELCEKNRDFLKCKEIEDLLSQINH